MSAFSVAIGGKADMACCTAYVHLLVTCCKGPTVANSLLLFLSAIVGSLGPSREADTSGLAGLTPFGWSMLALASTSFVFAIYATNEHLEMTVMTFRTDENHRYNWMKNKRSLFVRRLQWFVR
jgi:hypothetical protein